MGRVEYWNDPDAPTPNSLVPACGVLAIDDDGRVLLQRRRDTGQWAIPMGKMELGETPTQCAIRETQEETGVLVTTTGLLGIFSDPGHIVAYTDGETRQEYEVILLGRPVDGDPGSQRRGQRGRLVPPRTAEGTSTSTRPSGASSTTTCRGPTRTSTDDRPSRDLRRLRRLQRRRSPVAGHGQRSMLCPAEWRRRRVRSTAASRSGLAAMIARVTSRQSGTEVGGAAVGRLVDSGDHAGRRCP